MRKFVLIGLTALALIAACLFAALHFHSFKTGVSQPPLTPSQAAERVKPGFIGTQVIGAWTLVCKKPHHLPPWVKAMLIQRGNHFEPQKSPHCQLSTRLTDPKDAARWAQIIYTRVGNSRFFNISMKVSSAYWAPDEYFSLRMDGNTVRVK